MFRAWFGHASRCTLQYEITPRSVQLVARIKMLPHGDQQHEPHKIKKLTSHEEKSAFDITYSVV